MCHVIFFSEVNKKKHMVCAVGVSRNWTDKVARQYFPGCTTLYKELERFKSKSPVYVYLSIYKTELLMAYAFC